MQKYQNWELIYDNSIIDFHLNSKQFQQLLKKFSGFKNKNQKMNRQKQSKEDLSEINFGDIFLDPAVSLLHKYFTHTVFLGFQVVSIKERHLSEKFLWITQDVKHGILKFSGISEGQNMGLEKICHSSLPSHFWPEINKRSMLSWKSRQNTIQRLMTVIIDENKSAWLKLLLYWNYKIKIFSSNERLHWKHWNWRALC